MKVEDLLASIRKSVDDDMDGLGASMATQSRGTLMRGALREMRVNLGGSDFSNSVQDEISTLRERIKAKVAAREINLETPAPVLTPTPVNTRPLPIPAPSRGNFSTILDAPLQPAAPGQHLRNQVDRARHLPLRSSHFNDGESDVRYQPEADGHGDSWGHVAETSQSYQPSTGSEAYYQDNYREEQPQYPALQAPLLSPHAEAAAETAFRQLSDSLLARATGDRSIEDMTRELLRGMIKQWLDANLPGLVEELVREEIERVARRGR